MASSDQPAEQDGDVADGYPHLLPAALVANPSEPLFGRSVMAALTGSAAGVRPEHPEHLEPLAGVLDGVGGVVQVSPSQQQLADRDTQRQRHRFGHAPKLQVLAPALAHQ